MKVIKVLVQKIESEMHDAEEYAKLASAVKEDYPELADTYLTLSKQEVTHVNMLHAQAERIIQEYRDSGNDPPPAMMAVYEWQHEKMIDGMARIKILQDLAR